MELTETVSKINRILEGLMGCTLEFRPADALTTDEWNLSQLELIDEDDGRGFLESESSGDFGFPINVNGAFAGLAVVNGSQGLRHGKLLILAELLSVILEKSLVGQEREESARIVEERLQVLQLADEDDSNVVPMRTSRLERVRQMIADLEASEARESVEETKSSSTTSVPLLITTASNFPLQYLAIEIHQTSGRWAMLSLADLPADVLDSREGLKELGGVTIFIRDLRQLSGHQQEKLAEYLAMNPSTDMPQVIAGLNADTEQTALNARLASQFCRVDLAGSSAVGESVRDAVTAGLQLVLKRSGEAQSAAAFAMQPAITHASYFDPDQATVH